MTYNNKDGKFLMEESEKLEGLLDFCDNKSFETAEAKKNIDVFRGVLDRIEKHLNEYEVENEILNLNKNSAQYDCEMYIKENRLEYIHDEVRAAYKKGFIFGCEKQPALVASGECDLSREKLEKLMDEFADVGGICVTFDEMKRVIKWAVGHGARIV